jgi:hypothetical protein
VNPLSAFFWKKDPAWRLKARQQRARNLPSNLASNLANKVIMTWLTARSLACLPPRLGCQARQAGKAGDRDRNKVRQKAGSKQRIHHFFITSSQGVGILIGEKAFLKSLRLLRSPFRLRLRRSQASGLPRSDTLSKDDFIKSQNWLVVPVLKSNGGLI